MCVVVVVGWFFGPMDARETCFDPCVVAVAYTTAVFDTARYIGTRWLICTHAVECLGGAGITPAIRSHSFISFNNISNIVRYFYEKPPYNNMKCCYMHGLCRHRRRV